MLDYKFIILIILSIKFCQCNKYLLPNIVTPAKYDLKILATLYENELNDFTFTGQVNIEVICNKESNKITLHSHELGIRKNILVKNKRSNKTIEVTKFDMDTTYDFLHIYLNEPIEVSETYDIVIQFYGNITTSMVGFYRSSYKCQENNKTSWLAVTQFEPTYARHVFPCFDEPAYKARFNIGLGHNKNLVALSNMPLKNRIQLKEYVIDLFQETEIMSTYLVAFIICDFAHVTSPSKLSNTTFKIWTRKGALSQATFAQITGPRALTFFENYFKIPFPLPKQDMVAIPDFGTGAMENWGLITYRESAFLVDKQSSDTSNKKRAAEIICHELAHQWFGNLVTMEWWNDLWLNEGFATYMAVKCVDRLFPAWNYDTSQNMMQVRLVYEEDSLESTVPLSTVAENPDDIAEHFGVITYKKGSAMIRMLEKFLEEDVLRAGLTKYLNKHRFGNAKQDDLWNALTKSAQKFEALPKNLTVKTIMDTWTLQTGYPVVNVKRNYKTGRVEVTQNIGYVIWSIFGATDVGGRGATCSNFFHYINRNETKERFLQSTNLRNNSCQNNCWWIPFTYTTADVKDFITTKPKLWLSSHITTFEYNQAENWIIGNIQRSGLYRINYDEENWRLIIKHLKNEKLEDINEKNRVALIDDIMALANLDKVNLSVAFDLLKYLQREEKLSPWNAAIQCLKKIHHIFDRSSHRRLLMVYMQQILKPMYLKYGGFKIKENKVSDLHKLIVIEACTYNVELCENDAIILYLNYIKRPQKSLIHKDFRKTVFCTAIRKGGQEEWDYFWKEYLNSNIATERVMLLESLACASKKDILTKYIQFILEDNPNGVRSQDALTVFYSIADNRHGYDIAKSFLYENASKIITLIKSKQLGIYVKSIAIKIADEDEFEKFKKFILDNPGFRKYAHLSIQQAIETIELNILKKNIYFSSFVENL